MRKYLIILLLACTQAMVAQVDVTEERADSAFNIVDVINSSDGAILVQQPRQLDPLVGRAEGYRSANGQPESRGVGYRIQVFSDNNVRTAKANAEARKRAVEQQTGTKGYLTYEAPYWRVRVGDYRSRVEADAAMREIKNAFPAFAGDIRIVRERINVTQ